MENVITHSVQKDINEHQFYCDECNKLLGTSTEYDDGYYAEYGRFEQSVCIKSQQYTMRKCLCDQCKAAQINKIVKTLEELGFSKK